MRPGEISKPAVPAAYARMILELAAERGAGREAMLSGLRIPAGALEKADARLTQMQISQLLYRAIQLTHDPAMGYAIGLHSGLTSHGFIGYGLLSYPTLRAAIEFGARFVALRTPFLSIRLLTDGKQGVIEVSEQIPFGPLRRCTFDLFLVGLWRMWPRIAGEKAAADSPIELWFDYPKPDYYAAYQSRLPPMRFGMGANQLRFPAALLDRPINTADVSTAQLVTQQCEREMSMLGYAGDFLSRVRAVLVNDRSAYPGLEAAAKKLHVSSRTFKRRLQEHGTSFQDLLDEVRRRDSMRLLQDSELTVEEIASRVGYTDRANFARAFRKWTGSTPSEYRAQQTSQ